MSNVPWQIADVPGPRYAALIKPDLAARLMKRAKKPLIALGGGPDIDDNVIKYVLKIARILNSPIAVSPGIYRKFLDADDASVVCIGIQDLVNRLRDEGWSGLDGAGGYDLIVFLGARYYFESLMLATTKHFAMHLKTIALDRFYQPNADFSLGNMSEKKWFEALDVLVEKLR